VIDRERLVSMVTADTKGRFELSDDGRRVRARQGHTIEVDAGWAVSTPPPKLWHGTGRAVVPAIVREGLLPMGRHHVHLSETREAAWIVARRRPEPVLLVVDAAAMHAAGHVFRVAENGPWLVEVVRPEYLRVEE
jgi:putative RNA 2'-phosphotransferase